MLQLSENTAFVSICRMYIHTVSTIGKEQQIYTWCLGGIIYIQTVQSWGQDGTLWHPACISLGIDISLGL
jgi:hypothetical protein